MNKYLSTIAGCVLALGISTASAKTFNFTWTADNDLFKVYAHETLSDALNSVGGYDILSISGNVVGQGGAAITGLIINPNQPNQATGGVGPWNYDNVQFTTAPWFNNNGVLFTAGSEYNLYTVGETSYLSSNGFAGYNPGTPGRISAPEASTWIMMLAGFVFLGLTGHKKIARYAV